MKNDNKNEQIDSEFTSGIGTTATFWACTPKPGFEEEYEEWLEKCQRREMYEAGEEDPEGIDYEDIEDINVNNPDYWRLFASPWSDEEDE